MSDLIDRQDAIEALHDEIIKRRISEDTNDDGTLDEFDTEAILRRLPPAQSDGYIKIPETGIDDLSDGFHTFRQLYYQRMVLFATIVKQNKEKAWKSLRHEDGELCFGGGWFIVGIDTPEGSYTYHYEDNFYSLFDCEELERAKHWDGHTETDVTRLLSLPPTQPKTGKWIIKDNPGTGWYRVTCSECGEDVTSTAPCIGFYPNAKVTWDYCPNCGARMEGEEHD